MKAYIVAAVSSTPRGLPVFECRPEVRPPSSPPRPVQPGPRGVLEMRARAQEAQR